ncbi:hypothetical protein GF378_01090 [Candidatus Pacearchaeota archaeon]|nr:hypothetical protein [Candidatus Pacearchaeota archaeon]
MATKRKIKRFVSKAVREIVWYRENNHKENTPPMPKAWTPQNYRRSYSLGLQLGFDSLDIMDLISNIESEFQVEMGEGENYYQRKGDYYIKTQNEIVDEVFNLVKSKEKSLESKSQTSFINNLSPNLSSA